jgi:type II secretory pathway pseudopilin PulG
MTLNHYKGKKTQQGIGIVEFLIALALIGAALVFVYANATKATGKSTNQQIINEVQLIKSAATAWRGSLPTYTGISITELTGTDFLDTSWGSGTGINPVGGNYTVTVSGTDATAMVLTVTGMEDEQCAGVARTLDPSAASGTTSSCTSGTLSITFR